MPEKKTGQGTPSLRNIALEMILLVTEEGVFCDKALHQTLKKYTLDRRDKGFLTRILEGTVERQITIDYILNQYSKVKVSKMKPVIRGILRISVYQILYMDQIPDSAACNEAVKLVQKRKFHNLKGYVNGVLRTIAREKDIISLPEGEEIASLSIFYSMPEWILERWVKEYGIEDTKKMCQFFIEKQGEIAIRPTLSRFSSEEIEKQLENEQVIVQKGHILPYARLIRNYGMLENLDSFQKGMFQVQDESSMLVAEVAGIKKDDVVIDICAAPGGKTMHIADILAGSGKVISADLTEHKVTKIRENYVRLGYHNIEAIVNDARVFREDWKDMADVVIADLPCSGLGVIGKKADIKYKTNPEDIVALAKLQREILQVVANYVKPGGTLVFSTCTIAKEENQENAIWIAENLPFYLVSMEERLPQKLQGKTGEDGYLQVLPQETGTDGFFLAYFKKQS